MEKNLVSVIIPSYNYGAFIGETIRNVQTQSYRSLEIIVVNDGSTDNTREIVQELALQDQRIQLINIDNGGLSNARNTGLRKAKGEFIQFLDSDDLLSSEKISSSVDFLTCHPETDIVYTDAFYFCDNRNVLSKNLELTDKAWMPLVSGREYKICLQMVKKNIFPVNCPLFRASILQKVPQFEINSLFQCEDWLFWFKCCCAKLSFHFLVNPEAYAIIRVHHTSMSSDKNKMYRSEICIRNLFYDIIDQSHLSYWTKVRLKRINRSRKFITCCRLLYINPTSATEIKNILLRELGIPSIYLVYLKVWSWKIKQKNIPGKATTN
jgi:glycosyltransferase involved in cell wall biosynthesis